MSTHLYKIFVEDLLVELEKNATGFSLGDIYCGTPTCADDIALISSDPAELQIMLNTIGRYANQHHYNIHPTKSKVICYGSAKNLRTNTWNLSDNVIELSNETTHLGLKRSSKKENEVNIEDRVKSARRTKYALMNSGLHGTNGLSPKISYTIYRTYVLPRLLYGLEILCLTKTQIQILERFHIGTLRAIQTLATRTAKPAVYLLLGVLPVEAEIHKRKLTFLHSLTTCSNNKIKEIINRQIAVNFDNNNSFFFQSALLLAKYNLPDIFDKNIPIPSKLSWKKLVKTEISSFWTLRLKEEAHQMSSLKFLNLNVGNANSTHPVWDSVEQNLIEIRKASTKVRMLTGTYMVQADKHKFSQYTIDPTCLLCHREIEDILHVLTQCPVLCNERKEYFTPIKQLVTENSPPGTWELLFNNKLAVTQLVLDCTKYMKQLGFKEELILKLETFTRHFCFKLHYKRISLLKKLDG